LLQQSLFILKNLNEFGNSNGNILQFLNFTFDESKHLDEKCGTRMENRICYLNRSSLTGDETSFFASQSTSTNEKVIRTQRGEGAYLSAKEQIPFTTGDKSSAELLGGAFGEGSRKITRSAEEKLPWKTVGMTQKRLRNRESFAIILSCFTKFSSFPHDFLVNFPPKLIQISRQLFFFPVKFF
jgi:hypothetical protein